MANNVQPQVWVYEAVRKSKSGVVLDRLTGVEISVRSRDPEAVLPRIFADAAKRFKSFGYTFEGGRYQSQGASVEILQYRLNVTASDSVIRRAATATA